MTAKYSVRRPYTVLVAVVLVIVLGVVSLSKMTTDLLPDMSFQYALIITTDVGASPEEVETDVTAPIEAAIATTSNIKNVSSMSYNSYSIVICEYEQSANMDSVVIEIQQELDQLKSAWDSSVGSPTIMQINPDMLPVMMAAVDVDGMSQSDIANYVENELTPSLESVEGVASVTATGELEESIMVTLNQEKIDALNAKIRKEIEAQFDDAQKEIDDGKAQVEDGQAALSSAGDQLSSAYSQVTEQKSTLADTKTQLEDQLKQLEDQRDALEQVQSGISSFVSSTNYTLLTTLDDMIDYLDTAIVSMQNGDTAQIDVTDILSRLQEAGMDTSVLETILNTIQTTQKEDSDQKVEDAAEEAAGEEAAQEDSGDSVSGSTAEEILDQISEKTSEAASAVKDQVDSALDDAKNKVKTDTTAIGIAGATAIRDALQEQLDQADATIVEQFSALSQMGVTVSSYKDLPEVLTTVGTYLTQINTGIETIETALDKIDAGELALGDAVDMINQNAALAAIQIAPSAAQLAIAAASIEQGQSTLDSTKESTLDQADMNNILTIDTLSGLLIAQNFAMPAGSVNDADGNSYLVRVGDSVSTLDELKNLVLMDMGMDSVGVIRLSDVADVEIQDNSGETYAVINGNPGIILSMEKQTGYSTGDVTDRLLKRFDSIEAEKEGLHLTVLMNQGVYIDMVVDSVVENMLLGALLAIIVLFFFLKDIKPTLVIACSIPLSVIFAVVLMYFTGITLNIISMSGLVLGIGMLVDNSIVVIENIYRLRGEGYSIRKAAVEGASQVTGAIIASTLTTISVYAPIIFTEGITRQLFVDLALTIAYTLTASLLVAMTFVPMMSSAIMKKTKDIKHPWFDRFQNWYAGILEKCLKYKALVFVLSIAVLVVSGLAAYSRGLSFMDMEMETDSLTVTLGPKEDQNLEFDELCDLSDEAISRISDIEGIDTIGATAGGSSTMSLLSSGSDSVSMYVLLDDNGTKNADEITQEILDRTSDMDCEISASTSQMDYSSYFGSGITVDIKGNDLDKLQDLAAQVAAVLEETEGCIDVNDGLDNQSPQLSITVDKEKAASYGYTVAQVFQLIYAKMSTSTSATTISTDIKDYKVYLQTQEQAAATLDDIEGLTFTWTDSDGNEKEIPLTEIADMEETTTLSTINRDSQTRYIQVSCSIDDDHNVTLVSNELQKKLNGIDLPEGYSMEMSGEDETINDAMKQLLLMMLLAVIFIYLIMVAQFQSLLSPFIIMFSIPLAFTGGFIALFITGTEINVLAMLGFIMLAGVIVNNGIVLIDYINQRRQEGLSKKDAIIEAGRTRLRPILMTALTTILAMSTTAAGIGSGSAMIQPMGITIVGGLVYGTILTLIVIPCIYDMFNKEKNMVEEEI